jgi:hypothetical protein
MRTSEEASINNLKGFRGKSIHTVNQGGFEFFSVDTGTSKVTQKLQRFGEGILSTSSGGT